MSFRLGPLVVAAAVLVLVSSAGAPETRSGTLELDPSKTLIEFRLPSALHTTHGSFKLERGVIKAEPVTGEAGGLFVVDATSGSSGLDARDDRMKERVLEAQKYPEITLVPLHISGQLREDGQFQAKLRGSLTLHGAKHQIVADVQGRLVGDEVVAKAHFSVPYVEWGLTDPSVLFLTVAKQVDIDVITAGRVVWTERGTNSSITHSPNAH